jgi:hypothetical protein
LELVVFNGKVTESLRVVLKAGTSFQKAGKRHRFSIESGHRLTKLESCPEEAGEKVLEGSDWVKRG